MRRRARRAAATVGDERATRGRPPRVAQGRQAARGTPRRRSDPLYGSDAAAIESAAKAVQQSLGDHRDTLLTRQALRLMGVQAHLDGDNGFTYGRLHALEQVAGSRALGAYEEAHTRRRSEAASWLGYGLSPYPMACVRDDRHAGWRRCRRSTQDVASRSVIKRLAIARTGRRSRRPRTGDTPPPLAPRLTGEPPVGRDRGPSCCLSPPVQGMEEITVGVPTLAGVAELVLADKALSAAVDDARAGAVPALDLTGPAALRPFVVRGLVDAGRTVLAVAATAREAEDLVEALGGLMDPAHGRLLPVVGDAAPRAALAPQRHRRPAARGAPPAARTPATDPSNGPLKVVVAPVRSVLQPQVKGLADLEPVELRVGDEADLEDVVRRLAAAAYTRVDLVEKRGEFAVRGGIVDVFPPTEEHPLRVEFWGDEVEEIRSFAVADQRTLEPVDPAVGAAVPRAAAHRRGARTRPRARRGAPAAAGDHRQARRGPRGRGHGVAGAGAGRRDGAAGRPAARATRTCWCSTPSGRAAAPTTWWRPARSSSARPGRRRPAAGRRRSTSARRRTARSPTSASTPSPRARRGGASSPFGLDDDDRRPDAAPLRDSTGEIVAPTWTASPGRSRAAPSPSAPSRPTAATSSGRSPTSARWLAGGGRVVLVNEGHGPAQRMVEVLREHDVAGPARRRDARRRRRTRPASRSSPAAPSPTGWSTRRTGSRSSPATTCPGSARPPRTCARCRRGASSRSTRSSSSPATSSSTSSTASAATSR